MTQQQHTGGSRDAQDAARIRAAVELASWRYRSDRRETPLAELDPEDALTRMLGWHVRFQLTDTGFFFHAPDHGAEVAAYLDKHHAAICKALEARVSGTFGSEPE